MKNYIVILLLLVLGNICFSQKKTDEDISNVLNNIFKNGELISQNYLDFKGLKIFIDQPLIFDKLYGQPCIWNNSKVGFDDLIDEKEYNFLSMKISMFNGEQINNNLLNKNIKLIKSENKKNVLWITKPLIFNDKAIIYLKRKNEESIVVLKKNNKKKWIMICQKYLYLSLDN